MDIQRGRAIDDQAKSEFRIRFNEDGTILGQSLNSQLGECLGIELDDHDEIGIFDYLSRLQRLDPRLPERLISRTRKLLDGHEEFSLSGDVFVGEDTHHLHISGQAIRNVTGEMTFTLLFVDDTQNTHLRRMYEYMFRLANHELRGPLASIIGAAEYAEEHVRAGRLEGVQASLDMILRNAEVIEEMTTRYLNLSRIESGLIRINASNIIVSEDVLNPILSQMLPALAKRGMRVEFECGGCDREPTVFADAEKVDIVLRNLLSNALKYGTPNTVVRVVIRPEGKVAQVTVENEGPNIPQEYLSRLFQRFVRLDATQGTKGSGLGLYNARKVVEMWNGTIGVESSPQSTRFVFTLPLAEAHAATSPE